MATFEEKLVTVVEGGSSLKCYPMEKPQSVSTPVVVYKRLSTLRNRVFGARSTFNRVRMSTTIYGTTYSAVKSAEDTLIGLLDENTTDFSVSYLVDLREFKEPESGLYYAYMEFIIFGHLN